LLENNDTGIAPLTRQVTALAAVLLCGFVLPMFTGCAPNEQMIRMESEMDRLSAEVADLQNSGVERDGSQDRALRLLEERINTVQQENASSLVNSESVMNRLSALYSRMDDLESQLAICNQKVEALGSSMLRMERPENTAPVAEETAGGISEEPGIQETGSPEELYRSAFADYRRGNYELAVIGFKAYLEQFPGNNAAGDAHYWLGECHYAKGEFDQAIKSYDRVIQNFSQNSHVRGAYLKKGYAYIESNQVALGVVQLYHIIDNFPGTSEANLSQQRLEKMGLRRP
jgi:tol-pal system protein YbgF